MATRKDTPNDFELRRRAEEKLKGATRRSEELSGVLPEKMATLIHELEVHQLELKMQNNELRRIQGELERRGTSILICMILRRWATLRSVKRRSSKRSI